MPLVKSIKALARAVLVRVLTPVDRWLREQQRRKAMHERESLGGSSAHSTRFDSNYEATESALRAQSSLARLNASRSRAAITTALAESLPGKCAPCSSATTRR